MQEKEQQIIQTSDTLRTAMDAMDDKTREQFASFAEGACAAAMFLNSSMRNKQGSA